MNPITRNNGIVALAVSTAILLVGTFLLNKSSVRASSVLVVGAGLQSVVAFSALLWSLSKSDRIFFSVFVGDALLRLVVLALTLYMLWLHHMTFTAPLLTLAFSYLILSLVQVPFFCKAN